MIDNAINFVVGAVIFIIAGLGVVTGFYYWGRYQGRW
jgi:hypothetical protein